MKPLIPTVAPVTRRVIVANGPTDLILNSTLLGFKRSRLRMSGTIVSPMAGRVIAIVKVQRLLGFRTTNGKVYWWRLGLIWPTCPVVPFKLMVKVGDDVQVGQPLAIMVNVKWQIKSVIMVVSKKLRRSITLLRAELAASLKLDHHQIEKVITRTVINLAGNHQVKIIGPPSINTTLPLIRGKQVISVA